MAKFVKDNPTPSTNYTPTSDAGTGQNIDNLTEEDDDDPFWYSWMW